MPLEIMYDGHQVPLRPGDTVLEAVERAGWPAPSSCRAGVCQFCLMRITAGTLPPSCQDGLKESLKLSGHFLACVCRPKEPMACGPAHGTAYRGPVVIEEIRVLGPDVALVRLAKPPGFDFAPGQFITLSRDGYPGRSYSLASRAVGQDFFDIHVRRVDRGQMSSWFHDEARPGDRLTLDGPKGDCQYYAGNADEPLILVGTGTGIAPLFGIVQEAVAQHHRGPITIYQGAVTADRLYFYEEFNALAAAHANVRYQRCVLHGPAAGDIHIGDLLQLVLSDLAGTTGLRSYLCGDPQLVRTLKKNLFLRGANIKRIHADPFV